MKFLKTTHLSEILETSKKETVVIYIHSSSCGISDDIKSEIERAVEKQKITSPVYIVVVQDMPVLSAKIEEVLMVKHESPQVICVRNNISIYDASHRNINVEDIAKI